MKLPVNEVVCGRNAGEPSQSYRSEQTGDRAWLQTGDPPMKINTDFNPDLTVSLSRFWRVPATSRSAAERAYADADADAENATPRLRPSRSTLALSRPAP